MQNLENMMLKNALVSYRGEVGWASSTAGLKARGGRKRKRKGFSNFCFCKTNSNSNKVGIQATQL
jgi:hypothetical protein